MRYNHGLLEVSNYLMISIDLSIVSHVTFTDKYSDRSFSHKIDLSSLNDTDMVYYTLFIQSLDSMLTIADMYFNYDSIILSVKCSTYDTSDKHTILDLAYLTYIWMYILDAEIMYHYPLDISNIDHMYIDVYDLIEVDIDVEYVENDILLTSMIDLVNRSIVRKYPKGFSYSN